MALSIEKRGILVAIGAAFLATVLIVAWLNQEQKRQSDDLNKRFKELHANIIDAIFAEKDIPQGTTITEDMLFTKPASKNSLPADAATSLSRVIDRAATVNIKKGSLISSEMIGWLAGKETTLAMKTPIGKRAITIPVDNIASLMGMVKPGDYVDVISLILIPTIVDGKQGSQPATVSLFQNVQVIAVGYQLGRDQEPEPGTRRRREEPESRGVSPMITLALGPEEANLLAFVQEQGKIRLVLRSPGDAKTTETVVPASWETLLKYLYPNVDFSKPAVKEEPKVEVIRGFKKEMIPLIQKE
jgi:pilus assembly protein CpaB